MRCAIGGLLPDEFPILVGERRAPVLPPGIIGSVTHTGSVVAAIASNSQVLLGLGVDIEIGKRVTPDLGDAVLSAPEKVALSGRRASPPLANFFSAKEASFKAIHGLINRYIDFTDLALSFEADGFLAEPLFSASGLRNVIIEGRCAQYADYVATIAWAKSA